MASKIIVDQLESSGSNITIPTGTGLVVTDGIAATNLSGTIADARLPTVPVAKGGTGLTSLGSAGQAVKVNSAGNALEFGAVAGGKIGQVISTTKNDTWSSSGSGFQAVTGLSVSITPSATSSKVLILSATQLYTNDYGGGISLYKGGSQLVNPSSPSSRSIVNANMYIGSSHSMSNLAINYLDTPSSTSALTYQIYVYARSGTYRINRSSDDSDNDDHARTISTITAFEVLA